MKKLLFGLLLTYGFVSKAQVYNNEWIDYSKTYYKFKLGKNGVYRISQSVLASAGLGSAPAEQFQLWRNGVQVPVYTSVASGSFSGSDYIEFWGVMNDGKPDRQLYRNPAWQLNDKWSLETDTASYFLTLDPVISNNLRLETSPNNVAGNTLPAEPYFMYTAGRYFKDRQNAGYAVNVGEYLYSSSYDKGEGWTSPDLTTTFSGGSACTPNYGFNQFIFNNLFAYSGGPAAKFKIAVSGNAINPRRYLARINSDSILGRQVDFFNFSVDSTTFPSGKLNSVSDTVLVTNLTFSSGVTCPVSDRMVIHKYEITYPRQFNFGGLSNFEFTLPATATGNFLQITNFSYGSSTPVLYDLSNGKRYLADLSAAPILKFVLPPSSKERMLVLVSEENANINSIASLEVRNFINYASSANQGDYMIISNPVLFNGTNGSNPVEEYRLYRSSAAGGSYNAKIYLSDELIDQYGFGIKKNPLALRNFILYARNQFSVYPKNVFIIGRGVNYVHQRAFESTADIDKLHLVPTFGWPASDMLFTANPGSSLPEVPIGRLSAITPQEVTIYLKKVKEFEMAMSLQSPAISEKAWMKNFVHIIGASEPGLESILSSDMNSYARIIQDTLYGANVNTFSKSSSDAVSQLNSTRLTNLFNDGISVITYFGHSSATTLEFNLDNPENYNNFGKYPLFIGLGCNAGNFFNYSPVRLLTKETLSEKYVLSQDRGTIGFIASTHFGIVHYLDIWATRAYRQMGYKNYGNTIGEIMKGTAADVFSFTSQEDFYARCNTEETEFHGDPAIRLNPHPKPDYVIEDPMVRVTPGFISVADATFKIYAEFLNIGKSTNKNIVVEVKRQYPDLSVVVVRRDTIPGIRYFDSLMIEMPINPSTDKGLNKITVTVDVDGDVDEIFENNNSITKDVMIYEDEARPVHPYNYAIVNDQNIRFYASTANPFSASKQYIMEMDTTELFNSSLKVVRSVTSPGGVMEFNPGVTFLDSTVYYWRVAPAVSAGVPAWNVASFVYLPNSDVGYNQSHFFQHFKSMGQGISMDSSSRQWKFGKKFYNLFVREGTWTTSTSQEAGLSVAVNGSAFIRNTCGFQSVVFNVFDPITFKPMENITSGSPPSGLYGSYLNNCYVGRQNNFEFRWDTAITRKKAMDFMNNVIPDGAYVVVRSFLLDPVTYPSFASLIKYAPEWQNDTLLYGSGQSLYHYLKNAGLSGLDSFYRPRQFAMIYKKNDPSFTPRWVVSQGTFDNVTITADCGTPDTIGFITSPKFGPAKAWKEMKWNGASLDAGTGDNPRINIIGIRNNGTSDTLVRDIGMSQQVVNISSIDAGQYPFIQLSLRNSDTTYYTPYQLRYWSLTYDPAPEGAVTPNLFFQMKDTVDVAEPLDIKMAFRNISEVPFDSLKVKLVITDRNNVQHNLPVLKHRPLSVTNPDTLHIRTTIDTRLFTGSNFLYLEVNPDDDQPEQYHYNNFIFRDFYVRGDTMNPLLDVTFDNLHILNHDIVSSKPDILIKLKDEAKWFLLDNSENINVQVRFPDGTLHPYSFTNDTLQFSPAQGAPSGDNTATAIFRPYFPEDGEYELIVSGKDMSDNQAGVMQYRVAFQVINKPMISNMLNYPNPFTTSTAFVFTLTGTEVPQNIRIQILTVTGKIVREITKDELGPLRIGRNITEFKWDGTDQYGQKLANGVYIYRVLTNLNGKSLDKYRSENDNTDKYFNKGYGKMYLMR